MLEELKAEYDTLSEKLEEMRLSTLLTGEYDANNAILTFHAGAGGTEAQDWTQMLYRMYTMWTDRHGYKYTLLDYQDGEEAGIKSATIKIEGDNAYSYLKSGKRRPPPCAHLAVRRLWPPPHELCRRGGHARDRRGQQRDRAARRRDQNGHVYPHSGTGRRRRSTRPPPPCV